MSLPYQKRLIPQAKALRKEMTPQECHLWYDFLKNYPIRFQRQKTIGRCIVDFYCHAAKLAVELDGSQHYDPQGLAYDAEHSQFLTALGLEVLRFSNREIDRDFHGVCAQIDLAIQNRLQGPLSHLR